MIKDCFRVFVADYIITGIISFMAALERTWWQWLAIDGLFEHEELDRYKKGSKNPKRSHKREKFALISLPSTNKSKTLSESNSMIITIIADLRLSGIRITDQRLFHLTYNQTFSILIYLPHLYYSYITPIIPISHWYNLITYSHIFIS